MKLGGPVKLLVLQPTTFCNIDCEYCYLPDRNAKRQLTPELVSMCVSGIVENFIVSPLLRISWHSGEPLVMRAEYFRECFRMIRNALPGDVSVVHDIQTNGTLISEEWLNIFARSDVTLGLSLDGPKVLHDRSRKDRRGHGTFDKTLRGVKLLQSAGIRFSVICVIDETAIETPWVYEEFFLSHGIDTVSFNVPTREGMSRSRLIGKGGFEDKFREFYAYFARRQIDGSSSFRVVQVDDVLRRITRNEMPKVDFDEHHAFRIITVSAEGSISTFSPELSGFSDGIFGSFDFGTIFPEFSMDLKRVRMVGRSIESGIRRCQNACELFTVCGGGLPSPKYFDTGTFDCAEHPTCVLSAQALIGAVSHEAKVGLESLLAVNGRNTT